MHLKSENDLASALAGSYPGLTEERKQELLATVKATRPEKLDELHAIFTLPAPQGLSEAERAFYLALVEISGNEEKLDVGLSETELATLAKTAPVEAVPPASEAPATNGKPPRKAFAPGGTDGSTNGVES